MEGGLSETGLVRPHFMHHFQIHKNIRAHMTWIWIVSLAVLARLACPIFNVISWFRIERRVEIRPSCGETYPPPPVLSLSCTRARAPVDVTNPCNHAQRTLKIKARYNSRVPLLVYSNNASRGSRGDLYKGPPLLNVCRGGLGFPPSTACLD